MMYTYLVLERICLPRGSTRSIHDGGSDGASFCEPKKIHERKMLHPKQYLASKFSTQKNTSIKYFNIDLFNQTDLKTKQICDRSLDPKKYHGCKFSTQKTTSDLPVMYTASTPPGSVSITIHSASILH